MLCSIRRRESYSQRNGKSRCSRQGRCCMSNSVQTRRLPSLSMLIFSDLSRGGSRFYVQLDDETRVGVKSVVAQIHDHSCDTLRVFATIELQDVLYLQLRGTKAPTLSDTACKIPAKQNLSRDKSTLCTPPVDCGYTAYPYIKIEHALS
jgi:hypothetical protein